MAIVSTNLTRFPGGIGQYTVMCVGAAPGDVTCLGIVATDKILLVQSMAFDGSGYCTAAVDLTSEFVAGAGKIVNTGGTTTANMLVSCTYVKTKE